MKNSLALSEGRKAIELAGAKATDQALLKLEGLSEDAHAAIRVPLRRLGQGYSWWVGDYALSCRNRFGDIYAKALAEDLRIDEAAVRSAADVAEFYDRAHRMPKLTFAHHSAAIRATGGVATPAAIAKAGAWLDRAQAESLSVSELRAAIIRAGATDAPPAEPPEQNPFAPLDEADKWAIRAKAEGLHIPPAQRPMLRVRFTELIAFIDAEIRADEL